MFKTLYFDGVTFGQCKDAQRGDLIINTKDNKEITYGKRGRPPTWLRMALGIIESKEYVEYKAKGKQETDIKDPYEAPLLVKHMRANLEKCKQYVQECSVLTNSKSLNRPARRFAKGEIYDSNLCDLLFFDYVDMPGHDALFNDPTVNDLKLSFKTEKNPIAPRKGVVEVTLSNPTGKSIQITSKG